MARKLESQAPNTRVLATYREWRVTLPQRDTLDWDKLVRLVTNRDDMRIGWWTDEMIVTSLVSDAELTGNHEVSYPIWDPETSTWQKRVLAKVEYAPVTAEPVFNPQHYRIMLDSTDPTMPIEAIRAQLREASVLVDAILPDANRSDPESAEVMLRKSLDELTRLVNVLTGS